MTWTVDIPNPNSSSEPWLEVAECDARDEAIRYAREAFGADEEGRVSLVTGPHNDRGLEADIKRYGHKAAWR